MKRVAVSRFLLGLGFLLSVWGGVRAEVGSDFHPLNYRGGLRNSDGKHQLKEKQLQQVINGLAEKTGFREIRLDPDGFLSLGDRTNFVGGSASARKLLIAAVDGPTQLRLENHSHSSKVVFANLGKSELYFNMRTQDKAEHQAVRIDFSDFGKLVGPKEVIHSFDLGMTILHELVHGALKLQDSINEYEEVGDCERYVNTIRKELGLPERQQYVARSHTIVSPVGWTVKMAELQFARTDFRGGKLKTEEYRLSWDVNRVGTGDPQNINPAIIANANKKPEQKSTAAVQ